MCDVQAKIVDENNEVVSRGEKGELCTRGYNVMLGYWDDPEQTRKVIKPDGWYYTGYECSRSLSLSLSLSVS